MKHRLTLLGHRKDGRPIYLAMGAEDAPPPDPVGDPPADDGDKDDDGKGDLGDAGQKALDAMKAKLKAERAKTAAAVARATEAERKAKPEGEGGDIPDADAIRKQAREEARTEAQTEVRRDRTLDKIEVLAAKTFSDPTDARLFLSGSLDDFIDGEEIDTDAINSALVELLKKRPYLGVAAPKKFGSSDGGARQNGTTETGPGQMRLMAAYADANKSTTK